MYGERTGKRYGQQQKRERIGREKLMKVKGWLRSRTDTRQPNIVPKKSEFIWLRFKSFSAQLSSCGEEVSEFNKVFCICVNRSLAKL
jgi:hypothetical protein